MKTKDMTEKLYHTDSYLQECDAIILQQGEIDDRPAVLLDRTIFYPTSGGQMHDTGWLNDIPVEDVQVVDDKIWHLLAKPIPVKEAHARLDWLRRFDFMQQHTGFHLLAGSFLKSKGIETLSSHLGEEFSTIDVDIAVMNAADVDQVENLANEIIWQNRPIRPSWVSEQELAGMKVRKAPAVEGPIRLIDIDGFDLDPCGGTHVGSTGEVGLVKIIGRERIRKNLRFIFVAGRRALRSLQSYHAICSDLAGQLTTGIDGVAEAILKLQNEAKELRKKLRDLNKVLGEYHLAELTRRARDEKIVVQIYDGLDMETLRWLASSAVKQQGTYLLAATGDRTWLVFASSDSGLDLRPHFKLVLAAVKGKGGGEVGFVQGSGEVTDNLEQVLAEAKTALSAGG